MANPVIRVVAAVIERDGRYLITQRRDEAVLPGLWEFPGGRVGERETDGDALRRVLLERVGAEIVVDRKLAERTHQYREYDVVLSLYACHLPPGANPQPLRVKTVIWARSEQFGDYRFPPADEATMSQLLGLRKN